MTEDDTAAIASLSTTGAPVATAPETGAPEAGAAPLPPTTNVPPETPEAGALPPPLPPINLQEDS